MEPATLHVVRKKSRRGRNVLSRAGFTLLEMMITMGIGSILFIFVMSLMSDTFQFAAFFNNNAAVTEGIQDSIAELNFTLPQIVRVRECNCSGTSSGEDVAGCTWNENSVWYDPVIDGGGSDAASLGHRFFVGEAEMYFGGTNVAATAHSQLLTSTIEGTSFFSQVAGQCENVTGDTINNPRGCKGRVRMFYKAPVVEVGNTPSIAGRLTIETSIVGQVGRRQAIGAYDKFGMNGISVSRLSCGFMSSSGGLTNASQFVLNLRLKTRKSTSQTVSSNSYESWHPTGKNFQRGQIRDLRMKFQFRNISTRGLYHWRPQGRKNCKVNGVAASSKLDCCSGALSGGVCVTCIGSGGAGTVNSCCSEKLTGGVCS